MPSSDPPGPPEISGYIEGETIRLGQTVTLVCTAAGGNPLAVISWYRNGIKVSTILITIGCYGVFSPHVPTLQRREVLIIQSFNSN